MDAVKGAGNMGRGKDIQNIVDAEKGSNEVELKGESIQNKTDFEVIL